MITSALVVCCLGAPWFSYCLLHFSRYTGQFYLHIVRKGKIRGMGSIYECVYIKYMGMNTCAGEV